MGRSIFNSGEKPRRKRPTDPSRGRTRWVVLQDFLLPGGYYWKQKEFEIKFPVAEYSEPKQERNPWVKRRKGRIARSQRPSSKNVPGSFLRPLVAVACDEPHLKHGTCHVREKLDTCPKSCVFLFLLSFFSQTLFLLVSVNLLPPIRTETPTINPN